MPPTLWIILLAAAMVGIPAILWTARWLRARIGGSVMVGLLDLVNMGYVRWWHRLKLVGFDDLPPPFRKGDVGAGIVVANHSAGIDPLVVQAGIRRFIRWMMWADMMLPVLGFVWKAARILPVSYGKKDTTTVREAIRHLKSGGLVGIFPEGAITRPPGEIRPFQAGVGLVARMSKAPVLLIHIHDTPYTPTAFGSVFHRSRTVVEVVGVFDLKDVKDPEAATARLHEALAQHCGWPVNEESILEMWRENPDEYEAPV